MTDWRKTGICNAASGSFLVDITTCAKAKCGGGELTDLYAMLNPIQSVCKGVGIEIPASCVAGAEGAAGVGGSVSGGANGTVSGGADGSVSGGTGAGGDASGEAGAGAGGSVSGGANGSVGGGLSGGAGVGGEWIS